MPPKNNVILHSRCNMLEAAKKQPCGISVLKKIKIKISTLFLKTAIVTNIHIVLTDHLWSWQCRFSYHLRQTINITPLNKGVGIYESLEGKVNWGWHIQRLAVQNVNVSRKHWVVSYLGTSSRAEPTEQSWTHVPIELLFSYVQKW